jgi:hypothetical protein
MRMMSMTERFRMDATVLVRIMVRTKAAVKIATTMEIG